MDICPKPEMPILRVVYLVVNGGKENTSRTDSEHPC